MEPMLFEELCEVIDIGGSALKTFRLDIDKTNVKAAVNIDGEEFAIFDFEMPQFMDCIVKNCSKIKSLTCKPNNLRWNTSVAEDFMDSFHWLIERNKKITHFVFLPSRPSSMIIENFPESTQEVSMPVTQSMENLCKVSFKSCQSICIRIITVFFSFFRHNLALKT